MEYNLKKFLNGATVIPFRDDTLSALETICQAYIEDVESLSIIDEMSSYLYADVYPAEFTDFLQESINQSNIGIKHMSESLKIRLAQYVLYKTIIREDDHSERTFLCSNWMNYTVLKHNELSSLPNSLLLSNLYPFHIHSYILSLYNQRCSNESIETAVCKLLSSIPANKYEDGGFDFEDSSVWDALRHICEEATLMQINIYISKIQIESPNITTVYCALKDIVNLLKYPYYNIDIVNILNKILNGKRNTKSELWKYIEQLRNSVEKPTCNLESSIILRAIKSENDQFDIREKSLKMGIREFAVYVFYEFLLEKIELTKIQGHE